MQERILVVDDDPFVLSAFERSLGRRFILETAAGWIAGWDAVTMRGPYAVVVSDQSMPGMSGTGLLSLIRTASPDTIGVVLTGNPHDRELQHAIGSEIVSGVIEKPCDPDDVARALEDALHAHRERVKHE